MQDHVSILTKHGLHNPKVVWGYEAEWFEPPNRKRGGWSGVNYLTLDGQGYYLKRQENYQRHSIRNPFIGEPTYVREYEMLQYLSDKGVQTPELVLFAQNARQSMMITAELKGFVAADQWLTECSIKDKQPTLRALATAVRDMHRAGVVHRALFLKHLFVKSGVEGLEVAIIDFEKARHSKWSFFGWFDDIRRCLQRSKMLTSADKTYFLKAYWDTQKFSWWQQRVCHWLINARKEN